MPYNNETQELFTSANGSEPMTYQQPEIPLSDSQGSNPCYHSDDGLTALSLWVCQANLDECDGEREASIQRVVHSEPTWQLLQWIREWCPRENFRVNGETSSTHLFARTLLSDLQELDHILRGDVNNIDVTHVNGLPNPSTTNTQVSDAGFQGTGPEMDLIVGMAYDQSGAANRTQTSSHSSKFGEQMTSNHIEHPTSNQGASVNSTPTASTTHHGYTQTPGSAASSGHSDGSSSENSQ